MSNTYTVVEGDTLAKIGEKVGIPWKKVAARNGIQSPWRIRVGQILWLPSESDNRGTTKESK